MVYMKHISVLLEEVIENLKNKMIVNYDMPYGVKMYVSSDNLTKLRENINKYTRNNWYE